MEAKLTAAENLFPAVIKLCITLDSKAINQSLLVLLGVLVGIDPVNRLWESNVGTLAFACSISPSP